MKFIHQDGSLPRSFSRLIGPDSRLLARLELLEDKGQLPAHELHHHDLLAPRQAEEKWSPPEWEEMEPAKRRGGGGKMGFQVSVGHGDTWKGPFL